MAFGRANSEHKQRTDEQALFLEEILHMWSKQQVVVGYPTKPRKMLEVSSPVLEFLALRPLRPTGHSQAQASKNRPTPRGKAEAKEILLCLSLTC